MRNIYKILAIVFIAGLLFVYLSVQKEIKAATCEVSDVFWRIDGKDYAIPPRELNVFTDKTVKTVARFKNCNVQGNQPYFTFGSKTINTTPLTNADEQSWAEFDLSYANGPTQYFYAGVQISGQKYEVKSSSPVQIKLETCSPKIRFDATPKRVDSPQQSIQLKATAYVEGACVMGSTVGFEFYHDSGKKFKFVAKSSILPAARSVDGETSITPAEIGYGMNQSISFYAKTTIATSNLQLSSQESSPVNVGVGQAPAASKKYQCKNNACVEDASGPYNGLNICQSACGADGPVTSQYSFNLPNPIGVENFQDLVNIIGKWSFNLAIPIAVIVIIYAGVLMLTAGGNPGKFKKGAEALKYAVIGLAIVLIGKGFVTLIQSILSLKK